MVYTGNTDAHRKGNAKYLAEKVEDIRIRVPKGDKAIIQGHAVARGESLNGFVLRAIREAMERDNTGDIAQPPSAIAVNSDPSPDAAEPH